MVQKKANRLDEHLTIELEMSLTKDQYDMAHREEPIELVSLHHLTATQLG